MWKSKTKILLFRQIRGILKSNQFEPLSRNRRGIKSYGKEN